jgi:hypothetical protein
MENLHVTRTGQVKLNLNGRSLAIGQLKNEGRTFVCERSDNAVLRVNNSLGFNLFLMSRGTFEKVIVFMTPSCRTLETTRETILEHGTFLHFKSIGYEKQIFLKLSDFNKSRNVQAPFINLEPMQLGLFAGGLA